MADPSSSATAQEADLPFLYVMAPIPLYWTPPLVAAKNYPFADLIDSVLDLDDYEAVCDAIAPLFQRILRSGPKPAGTSKTPEASPPESEP